MNYGIVNLEYTNQLLCGKAISRERERDSVFQYIRKIDGFYIYINFRDI